MIRKGILAGGNWLLDRVKIVDRWPEQDTLAVIESESLGTGGSPYNLLVGLALLQSPFPLEAVGLVGRDSDGEYILKDCQHRGIRARHLRSTDAAPTSYTDVMTVRETGRRTFFHNHGANALLDLDHFHPRESTCRIFHLGYLLLLNSLDRPDPEFGTRAARLLSEFRAMGVKTSVDVVSELSNRFTSVVLPSLKQADYCILNEVEAGHCTGHSPRKNDVLQLAEVRKSAARLLELGVRELVVIHFPEGALSMDKAGQICVQGSLQLPKGYIQGSVGAGDAFCGGVLHGLHEQWPLEKCLQLGVANAAMCLGHPTSTGGIRPITETLQLLKERPVNPLKLT